MSLVVFTGGARSGKSSAAQRLALARAGAVESVTVAVFGRPSDPEMAERIAAHRAERPAEFVTLEVASTQGWLDDVDERSLLVVECMGTLIGRIMEEEWEPAAGGEGVGDGEEPAGWAKSVTARVDAQVRALALRAGDTIVVTNEVGSGVVPTHASGRLFRDLLGRTNRGLVAEAQAAFFCVAGRVLNLKELPVSVDWPED